MTITNFNAKLYLASNPDVLEAFGDDAEAAREHYEEHGVYENRSQDFDAKKYLAANTDLLAAFGDNEDAAVEHYVDYGHGEGRALTFDVSQYLQANVDLQRAFGDDTDSALEHYLEYGYREGRETRVHTDDDVSSIGATGVTTSGTAVVVGTSAADVYVAAGSTSFQGKAGADELKLLERGGADKVVFADPGDGAAAGASYGFDRIKNFQTGVDKVVIGGALSALIDHNGDGSLTFASRGKNAVAGTDEVVFFTGDIGDPKDEGMSKIARRLGATTGSGDVLVVASHEDESALYLLHATGGTVSGGDLRLLGLFKDGSVRSGDLIAG